MLLLISMVFTIFVIGGNLKTLPKTKNVKMEAKRKALEMTKHAYTWCQNCEHTVDDWKQRKGLTLQKVQVDQSIALGGHQIEQVHQPRGGTKSDYLLLQH